MYEVNSAELLSVEGGVGEELAVLEAATAAGVAVGGIIGVAAGVYIVGKLVGWW